MYLGDLCIDVRYPCSGYHEIIKLKREQGISHRIKVPLEQTCDKMGREWWFVDVFQQFSLIKLVDCLFKKVLRLRDSEEAFELETTVFRILKIPNRVLKESWH